MNDPCLRSSHGFVFHALMAFTFAIAATGLTAVPVKVAVYRGMDAQEFETKVAGVSQKGVMQALQEAPEVAAEYIDDFAKETLDKYDVLILCQTGRPKLSWDMRPGTYLPANWADVVREWVRAGHGLYVTHDAVGYREFPGLFPEIAVGTGNPFEDQEAYSREWCVASEHPISRGYRPKDRFVIAYYDTITMEAGAQGTVIARCIDKTFGEEAMSAAAALVCGEPGKGRYVANGAYIGGVAPDAKVVKPLGGERKLLLNAIAWLARREEGGVAGEDMGRGVSLGPRNACPIDPEIPKVDRRGLQGISCESVLAGCEIRETAAWKNALNQAALEIKELPDGAPIPLDEKHLGRPLYNPTPDGWPELDLCGTWKINKLKGTENNPPDDPGMVQGFWKKEFNDADWKERTVPSHWDNEDKPAKDFVTGYGRYWENDFTGVGWYRRTFFIPESFKGRRIILHFGGVDLAATAYVNGTNVGFNPFNGNSFEFDITAAARVGETNTLAVRVFDTQSCMLDLSPYHLVGGIIDRVLVRGAPPAYVKELRLNPRIKESVLDVEVVIQNTTGKELKTDLLADVTPDPEQTGRVAGQAKAFTENMGAVVLKPGINELSFTIHMQSPILWSCENPFLYLLKFSSGSNVLSKERFGFREFHKKDRFLYLNDKRVFLTGAIIQPVCFRGVAAMEVFNQDDSMRRALLALKSMGVNSVLPYVPPGFPRTFYDICDEIGLMVCDWTSFGSKEFGWKDDEGKAWFNTRYNHPSLVFVSLWNENRDANMAPTMNANYDTFRKLDKQQRPVCTSGGASPTATFLRTDVADVHLYAGVLGGHSLDMEPLVRKTNEDVWRYWGVDIPVTSFEMGGSGYYTCFNSKTIDPIRKLLGEEPPGFKEELIKIIEGVEVGYFAAPDLMILLSGGLRRSLTEDYPQAMASGLTKETEVMDAWDCIRQRRHIKGITEGCRRAGDLFQGWGYNWYPPDSWKPQIGGLYNVFGTIRARGSFNEYKRGNNPKYVCFNVFDQNRVSGGKFMATVYVVNDQPVESAPWRLRVAIKDPAGKRIADLEADVGRIPSAKRKLVPIEWDIPATLSGRCRLELFLLESGQMVADNHDSFFVLNKRELAATIPTPKKVALYDGRAGVAASGFRRTASALDELKMPYTAIKDFDNLAQYQVLIIGAHGIDARVDKAGRAIADWLENGGRLLQLEQAMPGKIPYLPQLSIVKKYGNAMGDLIVEKHPIFDGIRECGNWERWSGTLPEAFGYGTVGGIFSALIGPINRTVLADGLMQIPRSTHNAIQMLVAEVKVGKGIALLSQAEATRRYGVDSVATKYFQNLVKHILSEETKYAQTIPAFAMSRFDKYRCGYMDLMVPAATTMKVNATWLTTVTNGFDSLSGLLFRPVPGKAVQVDKASGRVELEMDISRLMFPEWEAQKRKLDRDQLGLATDKAEVVYFLHRAEGLSPKEALGRYVLIYKDGTQMEEPIVEGINIGGAGAAAELPSALAAGEEFYVTRWINPMPEKPLRRIVIEIASPKAKLTVLGITGYLVRDKVHD